MEPIRGLQRQTIPIFSPSLCELFLTKKSSLLVCKLVSNSQLQHVEFRCSFLFFYTLQIVHITFLVTEVPLRVKYPWLGIAALDYASCICVHTQTVWMNNQIDTGLSLCFPSHTKLRECRPTHCRLHFPLSTVKTTHQPMSPLVYQPLSISCYLYLSLTLSFRRCESPRIVWQINKTTAPVIGQHSHTMTLIQLWSHHYIRISRENPSRSNTYMPSPHASSSV